MDKSWAVKTDATIVDVKAIGAPIGGRKPTGAPRDGDGDGICWESTTPRPCPPGVPSGTRLPRGFTAAERAVTTQRQRGEIADIAESRRIKMRVSLDRTRSNNPDKIADGERIAEEVRQLIESSRAKWSDGQRLAGTTVEDLFKDAYRMRSLGTDGQVRTANIQADVKWWESATPGKIGYLEIYVRGSFLKGPKTEGQDSSGIFGRTFRFYAGTGDVEVHHDNLSLDGWSGDLRGGQVGSDFANISSDLYRGIGVSEITLDAASDGSYAWAVAGYDWSNEETKDEFLNEIEYRLAQRTYFASKDRAAIIDLVQRARRESEYGDVRTVTPHSFTLFSSSRQGLNDVPWSGRIQISEIAEMPDLAKSAISAVKETKETVSVTKISRKALRRIRDFGRGPGSGLDGDGDGLTDDGTPWERPAAPRVLQRSRKTWDRAMDKYFNVRKQAVRKRFKVGQIRYYPPVDLARIERAINDGDRAEMLEIAQALFEHEQLGDDYDAFSEVLEAYVKTDDEGNKYLAVEGVLKLNDDAGTVIGGFSRNVSYRPLDSLNLTKPGVEHDVLTIEEKGRGKGLGLSFGIASEMQYRDAGLEEMSLFASLSDGVYAWARDGFDWVDDYERRTFLEGLLAGVNATNTSGALLTDREKQLYRSVIQEALTQSFDSKRRLQPIHFAFMPKFNQLQKAVRNDPAQRPLSWQGRRNVRDYSSLDPRAPRTGEIEEVSYDEFKDFFAKQVNRWRNDQDLRSMPEAEEQLETLSRQWRLYADDAELEDFLEETGLSRETYFELSTFIFDYTGSGYRTTNSALRSIGEENYDEYGPPMANRIGIMNELFSKGKAGKRVRDTFSDKEFARIFKKWGIPAPLNSQGQPDYMSSEYVQALALPLFRAQMPALKAFYENPQVMATLPESVQRLFRGGVSRRDHARSIGVGDFFVDDAFVSASMDANEGLSFAQMGVPWRSLEKPEDQEVRDTLAPLTAHKVFWEIIADGASVLPGMQPESEWIIPPGSVFKVERIVRWEDSNATSTAGDRFAASRTYIVARLIQNMLDEDKSETIAAPKKKSLSSGEYMTSKALRRIRDLSRGPGSGLDGDGDGLTDDGTPWERPATPRVLERTTEKWGRGMDEYFNKRRDAAKRMFKRENARKRAQINLQTIQDAIDSGDDIELRRVANVLFAHEGLGTNQDVKSKVKDVSLQTLAGQQVISVEGVFVDDSGQELGYFIRDISTLANSELKLARPGVAHQELKIEELSDRGLGIGLSFGLASELQYKRAGLEEIALLAGLDNGVYTWARDGFDWIDANDRQQFLVDLLRGVNASNTSGSILTPDEKDMYRSVIQQALEEGFNDQERLRPIHFAFMPKFNKLQQAVKNDPNQGVARLNWYGRRQVRDYSSLDPSAANAGKTEVIQSQEEMFETVLKTAAQWRKKVGGFDDFNEPFQELLRARERWDMSYSGNGFDDGGFFGDRITEEEWKVVSDFLRDYVSIDYLDSNVLLRNLSKDLRDQPPLTAEQLTSLLSDREETAARLDSQMLKALDKYGPPTSIIVSNPEIFENIPKSLERLFRGQYSEEDLFKGLKVGDVIADDAFVSTSMDVDAAINFAGYELVGNFTELRESEIDLYGPSDFHRAIMEIKPSPSAKVIPGDDVEKEWILSPGTMFRITQMKRWDDPESAENSFTYVVVEMIERMLDD